LLRVLLEQQLQQLQHATFDFIFTYITTIIWKKPGFRTTFYGRLWFWTICKFYIYFKL